MNFCNNCGVDLRQHNGARFCHNCGNHLEGLEGFTYHHESKDNSTEVFRALKGGILNLLIERIDQIKSTLRAAFKTRYSDSWAKEEVELKKVVNLLISELKNGNNSDVLYAIGAFKTFLKVDAYGNFEKISDTNLNSFLNSSNGRAYGHCYTELIRLFNMLENKLSDSSSNQIESYNYENESNNNNDQSNLEILRNQSFNNGYNSYGIIFTNLNALADRLNCGKEEVESAILNYISQLEGCGHQYVLLDAGNNSYNNINADDGWQSHVELLKDFHNNNSQAEYLFIIGGHDVIPMAIIDNEPRCYEDDNEIDTDMSYAYLLNDNFEDLLWSGNLFKKDVQLYCGRLPIPFDRSFDDLQSYLSNANSVISYGIDSEHCFGMTAKSWEKASSTIISKIQLNKKLYTSPEYNLNSVNGIFNTRADLYYFNLHGSDSPGSPEFFGDQSAAISPDYLSNAEKINFLMTEACYGAKYIDYESNESMLLSSLFNRTVAYVGSSKVAFGASSENISSADVVAKSFLEKLLSSESCGKALAFARIDVFASCPVEHYDYGTTSAAEFNLFGDPFCSIDSNNNKKDTSLVSKKMQSKLYNNIRPEKKEIKIDLIEKGILNDVRNLVNQEILKIRDVVNKELYSQFNIEPRNLSSVFEIKGRYGETTYNYNYYKNSVSGKKQVYSVFADRTGKIKSIIQSK